MKQNLRSRECHVSPLDEREFPEFEQHLVGLRNQVDRNRQIIDNATWTPETAAQLTGLNNTSEFLTKVISQAQSLLDHYEHSKDTFPSPRALTILFGIVLLLASVLWPLVLSILAGR